MQAVLDETQIKKASLSHELEATVLAHGPVRMPLQEADGAAALAKAVNEALTRHHALGAVYDSRASSNMPGDSLRGVIAPGQQPARVAGDVRFKAKPQEVAAIVADLESSPDVESISRLTIEKDRKGHDERPSDDDGRGVGDQEQGSTRSRAIMTQSSLTTAWQGLLRGASWSTALGASLIAIAIGAVVLGASSRAFLGAVISGGADEADPRLVDPLVEQHAEATELALKRFNGRSAFFLPPPPRPPTPPKPILPPPPPPEPPKNVEPTKPPPPPATYTGPKSPYGIMGDTVLFSDGKHLKVGEEDNGVKVLGVSPPWTVRLAHKGGEYDVDLTFKRDGAMFATPMPSGEAAIGFFGSAGSAGAAAPAAVPASPGRSMGRPSGSPRMPTRGGVPASKAREAAGDDKSATEQSEEEQNASGEDPVQAAVNAAGDGAVAAAASAAGPEDDPGLPEGSGVTPPPLSAAQIDAMTREEAMAALGAVTLAQEGRDRRGDQAAPPAGVHAAPRAREGEVIFGFARPPDDARWPASPPLGSVRSLCCPLERSSRNEHTADGIRGEAIPPRFARSRDRP